ncbi:MAG: GGDEF domain-containing protein [Rhodobacter sp.]|nr:GGDEF domain-containing protein [Rhodobacter sp.]
MSAMAELTGVNLSLGALDWLMPMHAIVSPTGHIRHAGTTLDKLRPGAGLTGTRFLETFELRRPRSVTTIADLGAAGGTRLSLRLRARPDVPLKGMALPLPGDAGLLVNLSFGIAAVEAVRIFGLSSGDFPPTDLTIEMLYLVEAKEAVMQESRRLNLRLQGAKIAAEEQAYTDTLTGLKNRRAMDMVMERYVASGERFGLMHLDLDHFKEVNDSLGHAAGDLVLQEAARILIEETRVDDAVVRFGGDEFVLIFHRLTDPEQLSRVASRILKRLEVPILYQDLPCRISGSIGITISDDYATLDPDQMLMDADMALYASKNGGRARHTFVRDVGGVGQCAGAVVPVVGRRQ